MFTKVLNLTQRWALAFKPRPLMKSLALLALCWLLVLAFLIMWLSKLTIAHFRNLISSTIFWLTLMPVLLLRVRAPKSSERLMKLSKSPSLLSLPRVPWKKGWPRLKNSLPARRPILTRLLHLTRSNQQFLSLCWWALRLFSMFSLPCFLHSSSSPIKPRH